jgi:hypothetical protein
VAILKWLIPLANSSELWPKKWPILADSVESARRISHFKIATFGCLSGIIYEINTYNPQVCGHGTTIDSMLICEEKFMNIFCSEV